MVQRFNDLPRPLRANVLMSRPFGQRPADTPLRSPTDVSDLVAFLKTLTDDRTAPARTPLGQKVKVAGINGRNFGQCLLMWRAQEELIVFQRTSIVVSN